MNPLFQHDHLFAPLFVDEEVAVAFASERLIVHFIALERALAEGLAEVGAVSGEVTAAAVRAIDSFTPDMAAIRAAMAVDAMPVPEFTHQLKRHAGDACLPGVHAGATSQDLIDTAFALALRDVNDLLDARLSRLVAALDTLTTEFGSVEMMGRTRMQAALPITVADRLAGWRTPLAGARTRLGALRPNVEQLQFGGPVGIRQRAEPQGTALAAAVARRLGLHNPPQPWHTARAGLADYAGWLSGVSGGLGKIGQDVSLMAQQGVGEIALEGGGASSAMPHKQNPVRAETLVALARFNAAQVGVMHQALIHEQERSGAAWTLEWMVLPLMAGCTGKGLVTAGELLAQIARIGPVA